MQCFHNLQIIILLFNFLQPHELGTLIQHLTLFFVCVYRMFIFYNFPKKLYVSNI